MASALTDVLIVGGGIMGSSAAFFLRQRGKSVRLLERGQVGQQASGVNYGNIRRQGRHLSQLPLANRAREIWGRLPELVGEDCDFLPSGHLRVGYRPEVVGQYEEYAARAREYGLDLELLTPAMLRARFPYLGDGITAGSYSPRDGHANPRLASPAFARAAKALGADVREHTEVVSLAKAGGDFEAVTASGDVFCAPVLLVTTGAWTASLARGFGEPVPLEVHGPQMAVTEPAPYTIMPSLGVTTPVVAESVYLRQIPRGNVIMGGGTRGPAFPETRRARVEPRNTLAQMGQFLRLVPALAPLNIIRVWTGIESYLPDDLPVIGPSSKVSGLYYAFGFCGHGFQIGPGVGDVMAELIATGSTATPIEPFSIRRFVPT